MFILVSPNIEIDAYLSLGLILSNSLVQTTPPPPKTIWLLLPNKTHAIEEKINVYGL
jgi:hypothetical protein